MPKISVSRSVSIRASSQHIFSVLTDFNQWRPWSPWLITEPEAIVDVDSDARAYSWKGERTGEGRMTIVGEDTPNRVSYDLVFLKPWKSEAKVLFDLQERDGLTTVTWSMDSSLPFFMFWMKKMMEAWVGMDYERGLGMLKDYVETGAVPSHLEFIPEDTFESCSLLAVKRRTTITGIKEAMESDFAALSTFLAEREGVAGEFGLSIYHKYDFVKGDVEYTGALALKTEEGLGPLPEGMFVEQMPSLKVYKTRHTGPYRHLGNAWAAMMGLERAKAFKQSKAMHPFEVYVNNPMETEEDDLITEVCFAIQ